MGGGYSILNWSTRGIIGPFNSDGLRVALRVIMQLPNPSFDIMNNTLKTIETADWICDESGIWEYSPRDMVARSE